MTYNRTCPKTDCQASINPLSLRRPDMYGFFPSGKRTSFTLIELLVVIAIIAVLRCARRPIGVAAPTI